MLVVMLHAAGLLTLMRISEQAVTPAEVRPIEIALIQAQAPTKPVNVEQPAAPTPAQQPAAKPQSKPPATPLKPVTKYSPAAPSAVTTKVATPAEHAISTPAPTAEALTRPTVVPTAPSAPAPAPAPIISARFDAGYLNNPAPAYPQISRRMREEGKVVLRVLVSPEGKPEQVDIVQSSGSERLDNAAHNAVSRWRFVPARQGEQAIESAVLVPIIFKLEGS